ncbi:MAG: sigma-54 dependent transcriptional regulator [Acidobacteriota bacterium]
MSQSGIADVLIGEAEPMHLVRADIECAARSDAKVLITGETGVGKDVAARLIHQRSARSTKPMVTINCAGVPDSLLESELFGHVRGSFTGAFRDKVGLLESAPNGTVFLDEVGEMTPRMQMVLLRFLETGELQRVGATRAHTRVNIRLITATNRDLHAQIATGAFREDLYYRLNVIRLLIPPLRDRRSDIPLLVQHFFNLYSRQHGVPRTQVTPAAMDVLVAHAWPGNVRELKNVIERVTVRAVGRPIVPADLPADVFAGTASAAAIRVDTAVRAESVVDALCARLFQGESFWTAVYPQFVSRDLTRDDLRKVVQVGLERTSGNYRLLVQLFNMPVTDYRRFLAFLRKHSCHLPFQQFRQASAHTLRGPVPTDIDRLAGVSEIAAG